MKKVVFNYLVIAALAVTAAFTSCGGGSGSSGSSSKSSGKIKMTTERGGECKFRLAGSGVATVDWGDGSEKTMLTLNESREGVEFNHTYPNASLRTITINGDNITMLSMPMVFGISFFDVTSLDVSRCTELTILVCNGKFTSLDVSKNTALIALGCSGNLTAAALNALFKTLHSNAGEKYIDISGNPGAGDCDRTIAERKGWRFE